MVGGGGIGLRDQPERERESALEKVPSDGGEGGRETCSLRWEAGDSVRVEFAGPPLHMFRHVS